MGVQELQFDAPPTALPLRSLNHISRVCQDVKRSVRFYRDVLGFVEIKRPDSFDFEGSWLFNYGIGVHLISGQPLSRPAAIDPKADHLSFQSDNLDEIERRLTVLGIPYKKASVEEGGVRVSQVFFHDPDRAMIEICNCDCLPVTPLSRRGSDMSTQSMFSECLLSRPLSAGRAPSVPLSRPGSANSLALVERAASLAH